MAKFALGLETERLNIAALITEPTLGLQGRYRAAQKIRVVYEERPSYCDPRSDSSCDRSVCFNSWMFRLEIITNKEVLWNTTRAGHSCLIIICAYWLVKTNSIH
ncbi:hypothetical protein Plhal304r1_c022g0078331 [Plasmopara halstedii]